MEEQQPINDNIPWKSCCWTIDPNFMKYMTQITISYIILTLAIYKLIVISKEDNEDKSIYISLITLILGIYTTPIKLRRNVPTLDETRQSNLN